MRTSRIVPSHIFGFRRAERGLGSTKITFGFVAGVQLDAAVMSDNCHYQTGSGPPRARQLAQGGRKARHRGRRPGVEQALEGAPGGLDAGGAQSDPFAAASMTTVRPAMSSASRCNRLARARDDSCQSSVPVIAMVPPFDGSTLDCRQARSRTKQAHKPFLRGRGDDGLPGVPVSEQREAFAHHQLPRALRPERAPIAGHALAF